MHLSHSLFKHDTFSVKREKVFLSKPGEQSPGKTKHFTSHLILNHSDANQTRRWF